MSDYLAYTSGVVRLFDTLDEANAWLAEVGGGKVFVAVEQLTERTLQHQTQLDNAVRLTAENDDLTARLAAAEDLLVRTRNGPLEWISPQADVVRHWLADMSVSVKEETIWHGVRQLHEVAVANQERRYILHQLLLEAAVGVGQKRFRSWLDDVRKALDITEIELASEVFKANEAAKAGGVS